MVCKSLCKVLCLALQPFDKLQNAIGAIGVIINLAVSLGIITIGGVIGWVYFPQGNQTPNWQPAIVGGITAFALFVVIAATKLQFEKDKLNDIRFDVEADVNNLTAFLKVTNKAQLATFRATGRIFHDNDNVSELLSLYWQGYGESVPLGNNDSRLIRVATRVPTFAIGEASYCGLEVYKTDASIQGFVAVRCGTWWLQQSIAGPTVRIEITIKPVSSSPKEYKAVYTLEQPSVSELVFRKIDPIPLNAHK